MKTKQVSAAEFGAKGDGETDDAPAIQAALDASTEQVLIGQGRYRIGQTLRIRNNTRLTLHPAAELIFANGAGVDEDSFLLTNADHAAGNVDITIEGGIWNGNNPGNPRGPDAPGSYSGVLLNFTNIVGLTLQQVRLRDAESYFVRLGRVRDFRIADITFEIGHLRPNQDGIHISGHCADGEVLGLKGIGPQTPNDDLLAILADDAMHRAQNLNGAFCGPIRRIRAKDLEAASCHSFVRLLSVHHEIEDIDISNVRGGCRCCAINMDACRLCRVQLFDEADHPDGVGSIRNVRLRGMHVFKASDTSRQPMIDFRTRVDNFVIEDFQRDANQDLSPETPTLNISKAGAAQVTLEGISPDQPLLAPFDQTQRCGSRNGMGQTLTTSVTSDTPLTLVAGGFARLDVRRTS